MTSLVAAKATYGQAVTGLSTACFLVLRHLSPDITGAENVTKMPPLWPSVVGARNMDLDIQCKTDNSDRIYHDETGQLCSQQEMHIRGRQCSYLSSTQIYGPSKNELICRDVCKLELKFEAFSGAIAAMCIIIEQVEARLYEQHLLVWANHYGWIKDKAEQMVSITKLPMDNVVANTIHCDDSNQTRDEPLYIPSSKSTAASAVLDRNMSQSSLVERGVTIVQSGQYKGESDIKHSSGKEI